MAVIGHAFLGWATGLAVGPRPAGHARSGEWPAAARQHLLASFWIPVLVVLAYLPDIAGQVLSAAGVSAARLLAHSLLFAGLAGVLVGVALARWSQLSPVRLGLIAVASIVGHDVVDLLSATDRMPLWPIWSRPLGLGSQLLPASSLREAAAFGLAFAAFEVVRRRLTKRQSRGVPGPPADKKWIGRAAVAGLVGAALTTHALRDGRDKDLQTARADLAAHDWTGAIAAADRAGRWPSTAHPGRVDYVRAEAHNGMGLRATAEREYRLAWAADPTYFWALADLAVCLASSNRPADERRQAVQPYLARLRADFANEPHLPGVIARIERQIGTR